MQTHIQPYKWEQVLDGSLVPAKVEAAAQRQRHRSRKGGEVVKEVGVRHSPGHLSTGPVHGWGVSTCQTSTAFILIHMYVHIQCKITR